MRERDWVYLHQGGKKISCLEGRNYINKNGGKKIYISILDINFCWDEATNVFLNFNYSSQAINKVKCLGGNTDQPPKCCPIASKNGYFQYIKGKFFIEIHPPYKFQMGICYRSKSKIELWVSHKWRQKVFVWVKRQNSSLDLF